jgi:hypothetical protein
MNNFKDIDWELLRVTLINGFCIVMCYLIVFFILNKLIANKKLKAIVIGAITPFFFYFSIAYLWYPMSLLLINVLKIDPLGLISGLIFALFKPLSLMSGILVTMYIIKKK